MLRGLFVCGIFNKSIGVLEHAVRGKSGLPSESAAMVVTELQLQESADVPEISVLGLRAEVDPRTRHAMLVNVLRNNTITWL